MPAKKSKLLLPDDKEEVSMTSEEMSELLEFQMKRLEGMQKVSKLLFKRPNLGIHFFKRGNSEIFGVNQKNQYNTSLYDLIKTYGEIITFNNNKSITIADTQLYSVEDALNTLKSFLSKTPTTCLFTKAGLLNGPIMLKIVLFPIFFLVGPTNLIAL